MSYGVTDDGFLSPTLTILREALADALRETFGASIDVGDKSILGQITAIFAERLLSVWEQLEAVNSAQDPDKATGTSLDVLCALTGTFRPEATHSTVTLTLTGTDATVVPAGSEVSTASTEVGFETLANATIAALDAWVDTTAYADADRVTNAGNAYECITAGTSAGSGGPDTDDDDITDGTVHWTFLGEGEGAVDVAARASESGVVVAVARDLTEIETSVGGWDGVINLEDADTGRAEATDAELRLLREQELSIGGSSTIDALRAEILLLTGVEACTVFANNTDSTDADGVPPHAVEVLVLGGEDQDIWDTLLANVAAGIYTHGDEDGTAEDTQGTDHTMRFSRPDEIEIYVEVSVIKDPDTYPEDGDDQIKEAIAAINDVGVAIGRNVVASRIAAAAFTVTGVLDVSAVLIDDAPVPVTSTTLPISLREIAEYDTSRIGVTAVDGVP